MAKSNAFFNKRGVGLELLGSFMFREAAGLNHKCALHVVARRGQGGITAPSSTGTLACVLGFS